MQTGTGIGDRNLRVIRVDIHGCENGFDAASYITIKHSYIHDLWYNSTVGDPHTDGLQSGVGAHPRPRAQRVLRLSRPDAPIRTSPAAATAPRP
jgi:hypothetical protein